MEWRWLDFGYILKDGPMDWLLEERVESSRTPRFLAWTTGCRSFQEMGADGFGVQVRIKSQCPCCFAIFPSCKR